MPGSYHYTTQEFRTMLPSSTSKDHGGLSHPPLRAPTYSHTNSFSTPPSSESFLSLRVPSPSLPLREMLELGRYRSEESSNDREYHSKCCKDTDRDSIATLVNSGDWVSGQSPSRSPSLLPSAPRLHRHHPPPLHADGVECRLFSTKLSPVRDTANLDFNLRDGPKRTGALEQTKELRSQLKGASFTPQTNATSSTRPVTPVPSLTHSQPSASSLSALGGDSPSATITVSLDFSVLPVLDTFEMDTDHIDALPRTSWVAGDGKPYTSDSKRRDFASTASNQAHHDEHPVARGLPSSRSTMKAIYPPWHPLADPTLDAPKVQLPDQPPTREFSHIDWDDDDTDKPKGASRMARMKKSFGELRAAERFISEATLRRKPESAKSKQVLDGPRDDRSLAPLDHDVTLQRHAQPKQGHADARYATYPGNQSSTTGAAYKHTSGPSATPAKLKKQPSRKSILPPSPPPASPRAPTPSPRDRRRTIGSELEGPSSTAPVTVRQDLQTSPAPARIKSKRKRGSASTARSAKCDKKKARSSGTVSKWVRKVWGSKKQTTDL